MSQNFFLCHFLLRLIYSRGLLFCSCVLFCVVSLNAGLCAAQQPVTTDQSVPVSLQQGAELQQQGFYLQAEQAYRVAYDLAVKSNDSYLQALSESALGFINYLLNRAEQAEPYLQQAVDYALSHQEVGLQALSQYYLGLLRQSQGKTALANRLFEQSLAQAEQLSEPILISRLHLALAQQAALRNQVLEHQRQALQAVNNSDNRKERLDIYLSLIEQTLEHPLLPPLVNFNSGQDLNKLAVDKETNHHLKYVYQLLQNCTPLINNANQRQLARYWGFKAQLYESQNRHEEALQLNQQAINTLKDLRDKDLLIFFEWQAGRLYQALGKQQLALQSYRRAVSYVEEIRQDIPVTYHNGKSSFLELFGPLYRNAMGLLLDTLQTPQQTTAQKTLREVQDLMERLKQTELEDFFQDRCLLTDYDTHRLSLLEPQVAVFYPIILDDRVELLLSVGQRFYRKTVPVDAGKFVDSVRQYATRIRQWQQLSGRTKRQLYKEGYHLYEWIIKPLISQLDAHHIDTLIYIPDGPLRLVPLGALYDGHHFLIERLAISTLPNLSLLPRQPDEEKSRQALLVGLSEPGSSVIAQLPAGLIDTMLSDNYSAARQLPVEMASRSVMDKWRNFQSLTYPKPFQLNELARALALPGVKQEVNEISKIQPSQIMLNEDYTLDRFEQSVQQPQHQIIHIASHGFFGGTSDSSFIMTYDRLLTLDHLHDLLAKRARKQPVDLLVLSACQTAEGDDRAPLGLSGIALRAHTKSALGSLWPISDDVAVSLMQDFYRGFQQQGLNKAKALQYAQLQLLQSERFNHPFFWSPFILIGHWK